MDNKTQIMDVTLRDGSYAVNFQFSEGDTAKLCSGLEKAGINYIEIGHGMGIGASNPDNGQALCSDAEYAQAAIGSLSNAKFGMFCIPGIASLEDIESLAENGGAFIRIGTNATEVQKSKEYIRKAKQCGLEVMANYMKSYTISPDEFRENVKRSIDYGTDVVYIVDSAGSMMPDDMRRYYDAIQKENVMVGFHGHNNLGMAVANSVLAIELGFDFVDTSLRGIGRSAGNATTELVAINMLRYSEQSYDYYQLLSCAEELIDPIYCHRMNAIDVICGKAGFHTSYLSAVKEVASRYKVNPLRLIEEYAKVDNVSMNEELLVELAQKLPKESDFNILRYGFKEYFGKEQMRI